jgi:hypothetical protein
MPARLFFGLESLGIAQAFFGPVMQETVARLSTAVWNPPWSAPLIYNLVDAVSRQRKEKQDASFACVVCVSFVRFIGERR